MPHATVHRRCLQISLIDQVAGCQMFQQGHVLPPLVADGHKTTLGAIIKKFSQDNKPKPWATIRHLEAVGRVWAHGAWATLFFLLPGATIYMLRVGGAVAITSADINKLCCWVSFYNHQFNGVRVAYELSPFM